MRLPGPQLQPLHIFSLGRSEAGGPVWRQAAAPGHVPEDVFEALIGKLFSSHS